MTDIKALLWESANVKTSLASDPEFIAVTEKAASILIKCFRSGNKVLMCGNGGSAADAQHIAAELSGRFEKDRPPLPAEALHVNSSYMTAVSNDYGFDMVYARMTEAIGNKGDILIGISTSGNSENVIRAVEAARKKDMLTISLTGRDGGRLKDISDFCINVPNDNTARIQEAHITIGHILCKIIEETIF